MPRTSCALLVATLVVAPGCSAGGEPAPQPTPPRLDTPVTRATDFAAMVANHTPFAGDSNKVTALLDATHVDVVGARTIALQTDKEPYGLAVSFDTVVAGATDAAVQEALRQRAVLVMACVDNLGVVSWSVPGVEPGTGRLTRAEANRITAGIDGQCSTVDELRATAEALG